MLSENVNLPCDDACRATVRVTHTRTPSTDQENTPSNLERFPDTAVVKSLDYVICVFTECKYVYRGRATTQERLGGSR